MPHLHITNPSDGKITDAFYLRINREIHYGRDYATIQAIKSPNQSDKFIVFAFGADHKGTKIAVDFLINIFNHKEDNIRLPVRNKKNEDIHFYPVKLIRIRDQNNEFGEDRSYDVIEINKNKTVKSDRH